MSLIVQVAQYTKISDGEEKKGERWCVEKETKRKIKTAYGKPERHF